MEFESENAEMKQESEELEETLETVTADAEGNTGSEPDNWEGKTEPEDDETVVVDVETNSEEVAEPSRGVKKADYREEKVKIKYEDREEKVRTKYEDRKSTKEELPENVKRFSQADLDKAVSKAIAKKLPPKEEMEEFKRWKETRDEDMEKISALQDKYTELARENQHLMHENAVVKAGVVQDAVDFVLFKVEKMEGEFSENLKNYLKQNVKYVSPSSTVVEGAEHKQKVRNTITRSELNAMDYKDRAAYKTSHPEEYAKLMGK